MNRSPHPLNRPLQAGALGAVIGALCFPLAHADLTLQMRDLTGGSDGNPNSTTEAETIIALAAPDATYDYTDHSDTRNTINVGNGSIGTADLLPDGSGTSDTYVLQATANLVIPAGTWSVGFQSDDGGRLIIPGITFDSKTNSGGGGADEVRFEGTRGPGLTWGSFTLASSLTTTIDALQFESGGGDGFQVFFASGNTAPGTLLEDTVNGWTVQVAPINDTDPPVISELSPADDSTGAYPAGDLVATFDEEIALTGSGTITVAEVGGDGSSDFTIDLPNLPDPGGTVSVVDTVLSIDPTNNLEFGQEYEVTISSGAIEDTWTTPNAYGGTTSGEWTFTTAAEDLVAPIVSTLSPVDDATGVTPAATLEVTFDKHVLLDTDASSVVDSENFESDNGGYTGGGDWAYGTPASDNNVDLVLDSGNDGSANAWGTVLSSGGVPDGGITPSTDSILTSDPVDLSSLGSASLSFAAAIDAAAGDTVQVLVRDAGDDSLLEMIEPFGTTPLAATTTTSDWASYGPFDISSGAGGNVYFEFRFLGTDSNFLGLYIDDVSVSGASTSSVITLKNLTDATETIIPVDDASQVSLSGATVTIDPAAGLAGGVNYAVQIGSTAIRNFSDVDFAGIADDTTWNFATTDTTNYIGTSGSGGGDKWNVAGNWDAGVPSGGLNAVIGDKASAFTVAATSDSIPTYTGDLRIGDNVTLQIGWANGTQFPECYNALGTPGSTTISMGADSMIKNRNPRGGRDWNVPAVDLTGDATFKLKESTEQSTNPTFDYPVTGSHTLTIDQPGTCTFNAANSFAGLVVSNGATVVAASSGSLGSGTATVNAGSDLTIGAADAMGDTGTLDLNGAENSTLLTMNADDTVGFLTVNGSARPAGTYGSSGSGATNEVAWISGGGILTVAGANDPGSLTVDFAGVGEGGLTSNVYVTEPVTYTISFSGPHSPALTPADLEDASGTPVTVESLTQLPENPAQYEVVLTADAAGTLQLQVKSGTVITDLFGNTLAVPAADDDVITVDALPGFDDGVGYWKPWWNGRINPGTGAPWAEGDTFVGAFVSGGTRDATSPDRADYDAFVQGAADAVGWDEANWFAIVSCFNDPEYPDWAPARDNNNPSMSTGNVILLPNGAKLADDGADLANGPDIFFDVTETGGTYNGNVGTGGGRMMGDPGETNIEHGRTNSTDGRWYRVFNGAQTSQWHIYALSEELTLQAVGGVPTPYGDWASATGVTGGFDDDDDLDGTPNGHEWYYFDSDPQIANGNGSPLTGATRTGASTFEFTHNRPLDRDDVSETYLWSSDLVTWYEADGADTDGTNTVSAVPGTPVGGPTANLETVTVEATVGGTAPSRLFIRQELTNP